MMEVVRGLNISGQREFCRPCTNYIDPFIFWSWRSCFVHFYEKMNLLGCVCVPQLSMSRVPSRRGMSKLNARWTAMKELRAMHLIPIYWHLLSEMVLVIKIVIHRLLIRLLCWYCISVPHVCLRYHLCSQFKRLREAAVEANAQFKFLRLLPQLLLRQAGTNLLSCSVVGKTHKMNTRIFIL
jgi:hypothetical protein